MQITCLPNLKHQSFLTVFCDGIPWRDLHTSVFGRHPTLPQECHSFEELEAEFSILEYRQAKNYAIRRLSLQAMLSSALVRSLKERLVSDPVIEIVVNELIEIGFVNDTEWAASFVRSQSGRKMGPRAIAQKLAKKGVRGKILEEALEKSWDSGEQETLIQQLLKSRYAKKNLKDLKERQKVVASLVRRGFDLNVILAVF